jgi:hypothetical protein
MKLIGTRITSPRRPRRGRVPLLSCVSCSGLFRSLGRKTRADHHLSLSLGGIIERHKNVSVEAVVARQSVDLTTPRRYRLFTSSRVLNRRLRWRAV